VKARLRRVRLELRDRLGKYCRERTGSPRRRAFRGKTGPHRIVGLVADCLRDSMSQTWSISASQFAGHASSATESADPLEA